MDATKARQLYEQCLHVLYNDFSPEQLAHYCATNVVGHPEIPGLPQGLEGLTMKVRAWMAAFSDPRCSLESFEYDQGKAVTRLVLSGVHTGEFMGRAPTGRRIEITNQTTIRIEDGKIVEFWDQPDMPGLMSQLEGASPSA